MTPLEIAKEVLGSDLFLNHTRGNCARKLAQAVIEMDAEIKALRCSNPQMTDAIQGAKYAMDVAHRTQEENARLRSDKPFIEMEDRIHALENTVKQQSEALREAKELIIDMRSVVESKRAFDDSAKWIAKYSQLCGEK